MNLDDVVSYLENWLKSEKGIAVIANLKALSSRFLIVPFTNPGKMYYTSFEMSGHGLSKSAWQDNVLVSRIEVTPRAIVEARLALDGEEESIEELHAKFVHLLDWASVCLSGQRVSEDDVKRVQLQSLTDMVTAWLQSEQGTKFLAHMSGTERIVLLEAREGAYVRTFELVQDGFVSDFYPASRPSSRGSEAFAVSVHALVEGMWKFGSFGSLVQLEGVIWERLRATSVAA